MDGSSTAMDGGWQWMAMDGNGGRDSHSMAMDSTAMDGKGLLDSDSTGMDDEEWCECDGGKIQPWRLKNGGFLTNFGAADGCANIALVCMVHIMDYAYQTNK
jgi:hypothetical protein